MGDWSVEQYLKFREERTQPSRDLVARIPLIAPQTALDVGCGPGNSVAMLLARFPDLRMLGIDTSPAMIATAAKVHPEAEFVLCAAGELPPRHEGQTFDIVFSNACLQWVPDHLTLFPRLMAQVAEGGVLAVQLPNAREEPVFQILAALRQDPRWQTSLATSQSPRNRFEPSAYYDLLAPHAVAVTLWETAYYHRLPNHAAIIEWIRGTALRPDLAALPEAEHPAFLATLLAALTAAYPPQRDGSVLFRFPRLFLIATR